jgi:hypothetical protein
LRLSIGAAMTDLKLHDRPLELTREEGKGGGEEQGRGGAAAVLKGGD